MPWVPSPKVWREYLRWIERKYNSKVVNANFRNKEKYGWRNHVETIELLNGKVVDSNVFKNIFFDDSCLRPSCYICKFKSIEHQSDITIADYWGIENISKEFDDNKGVSLVLINSQSGENLFNEIKGNLIYLKTNIETSMQPALQHPTNLPKHRGDFWRDFKIRKFNYIAKKYGYYGFVSKIKRKVFRLYKKSMFK